jgi:hypothetical protein
MPHSMQSVALGNTQILTDYTQKLSLDTGSCTCCCCFFVFFFVFPEFGTNEDPAVPDVCAYICSPEMQAQWPQCAVAAAWSHISSHAMPAALHELRMLPSCMYCMTDRSVGQLPSRIITNGVK